MRRSYFADREFRKIRLTAVIVSLLFHAALITGLVWRMNQLAAERALTTAEEEKWGGGGGGEDAQGEEFRTGPQGSTRKGDQTVFAPELTLLDIHVFDEHENAIPVPKKEEPKQPVRKKPAKKKQILLADNLPTRWVRGGVGPGSGGGAGGGSGGGFGKGQGYSIDWGGTGGRRLLSGRIPKYPEGTDKQMPVTLRFTVLPDGTVSLIVPARKSDEILENAAIAALRTWRFDPLPAQMDQKSQSGRVTFVFKLE